MSEEKRPPPSLSLIGEHILENPTGKSIVRCKICKKYFAWVNQKWKSIREDIRRKNEL